jgi:hypothetical protein
VVHSRPTERSGSRRSDSRRTKSDQICIKFSSLTGKKQRSQQL